MRIERSRDGFHLKVTVIVESNTVEGHSLMTDHSFDIKIEAGHAAQTVHDQFEVQVASHMKQKG